MSQKGPGCGQNGVKGLSRQKGPGFGQNGVNGHEPPEGSWVWPISGGRMDLMDFNPKASHSLTTPMGPMCRRVH